MIVMGTFADVSGGVGEETLLLHDALYLGAFFLAQSTFCVSHFNPVCFLFLFSFLTQVFLERLKYYIDIAQGSQVCRGGF